MQFDKVATRGYHAVMRVVGLKILKNKLSEYVRLAAAGETVLVTDRDRIIAELVPARVERSPVVVDAQLAEAVRQGWLSPPLFVSSDPPPRLPVAPTRDLLDELTRDRNAR